MIQLSGEQADGIRLEYGKSQHVDLVPKKNFSRVSNEYYNESPYCELVSSRMIDHYGCIKSSSKINISEYNKNGEYKILEEKGILYITLKILQNRQIAIPPSIIIHNREND